MATPNGQARAATLTDTEQLWQAIVAWLKTNSRQATGSALVAAAFAYAANFVMMLFLFDGYAKFDGSSGLVTSLLRSTLFWGIASTIFFTLLSYRRAVGKERFWADVNNLPATIETFFRQDGKLARVHLL